MDILFKKINLKNQPNVCLIFKNKLTYTTIQLSNYGTPNIYKLSSQLHFRI